MYRSWTSAPGLNGPELPCLNDSDRCFDCFDSDGFSETSSSSFAAVSPASSPVSASGFLSSSGASLSSPASSPTAASADSTSALASSLAALSSFFFPLPFFPFFCCSFFSCSNYRRGLAWSDVLAAIRAIARTRFFAAANFSAFSLSSSAII